MVKRLISANTSEVLAMDGQELKQSIKASEGRVVLSENVTGHEATDGLTTSEIAAAFSAINLLSWQHNKLMALSTGERHFIFNRG